MRCKYCQSESVVKNGSRGGMQRYLCKGCGHKFFDNQNELPRMRTNTQAIVTAIDMFYSGLSTRKVAIQLENIYGESVSQSTVHYWVHKYTKLVTENFIPMLEETLKLSGKYHHDETEIKVGLEGRYFWETIDADTRYIVAHLLSDGRSSDDAKEVFRQALKKQRPTALFTDGSFAYDSAFKKVYFSHFKANQVEWVRRVGIRARETNNIVERLHQTVKERTKVMRGLKNDESTANLLDGYVINYNYCRKHQSIKMTPAQAAGVNVKGWKQLIEGATVQKTQKEKEVPAMEVEVEV